MTVTTAAINSAATIDIQIPSIPHRSGKIKTAATWKTRVRKNEIRAEISPFPRAVKKDEPKMAIPANRNEKE